MTSRTFFSVLPDAVDNVSTVLISLTQSNGRDDPTGLKRNQIGFFLYSRPSLLPPGAPLDARFLGSTQPVGSSGKFLNLRQVQQRLELSKGEYVLVVATFFSDVEGSFLIRVYADQQFQLQPLRP